MTLDYRYETNLHFVVAALCVVQSIFRLIIVLVAFVLIQFVAIVELLDAQEFRRVAEHVVIDKPVYTNGRSIEIYADILEFKDAGLLHSGYSRPALPRMCFSSIANSGGNILIVAREIKSLRVSSKGQTGAAIPKNCAPSRGGPGGDSGNVTIRYLDASPTLNMERPSSSVVDRDGGEGGQGSPGHPLGPKGQPGQYQAIQFTSEIEYYEFVLDKMPAVAGGLLRKAELLFIVNDLPKAKELLQRISSETTSDVDARNRAVVLLERLNKGYTFFNTSPTWAPILLENSRPRTIQSVRRLIEEISTDIYQATEHLNYREKMAFEADLARNALAYESSKIEEKLAETESFEREYLDKLRRLRERIEKNKEYVNALKERLSRLFETLRDIPDRILKSIESVSGGIAKAIAGFTKAAGALTQGAVNPLAFVQGVAEITNGVSQTSDGFANILAIELDIKRQIEEVKDKIFLIRDEVSNDASNLTQYISRVNELQALRDHYVKQKQFLENAALSSKLQDMEILRRQSQRVFLDLRIRLAAQVYELSRYLDLLLLDNRPLNFGGAPGGITETMSAEHLRNIKAELRSRDIQQIDWADLPIPVSYEKTSYKEEYNRLKTGKSATFLLIDQSCLEKKGNEFLKNAHVGKLTLNFLDEGSRRVGGLGDINYTSQGGFVPQDSERLELRPSSVSVPFSSHRELTIHALELQSPKGLIEFEFGSESLRDRVTKITGEVILRVPIRRGDSLDVTKIRNLSFSCSLGSISSH